MTFTLAGRARLHAFGNMLCGVVLGNVLRDKISGFFVYDKIKCGYPLFFNIY